MRSPAATVAILVILTTFAGCARIRQDRIVGRWQAVRRNARSKYFADGTVIITDASIPTATISLNAKRQRLDDGWLKVETTILGISTAEGYRVEIRGDQLTFTDLTGRPCRTDAQGSNDVVGAVRC
jgi:hypothetical protein